MFEFVDDSFDIEKTNEYILSIQLTLGGFSFSLFSPHENKIVGFKQTPLKISSESLIVHHFDDWIKNEEILQKKYSKTNLIYFSTEFSLIPEVLYSSQLVKVATKRLIAEEEQKNAEIISIEKSDISSKLLFYLPKNLKDFINTNFTAAKLTHPVKFLIEQTPNESKKNKVVIIYTKKGFIMVASRNENVLLANGFKIEHINDLVYFLLNALTQLNLNLKETTLLISEAFTQIDDLENLLRPYFPEISYLPSSDLIENAGMISNSLHRYFSFK